MFQRIIIAFKMATVLNNNFYKNWAKIYFSGFKNETNFVEINFWWFSGACNTCVKLQSRVTSSGATVNSWMIQFYFIFILFVCFVLLGFCCCCCCFGFFLFVYLFLFLERSAVFISMWEGVWWSYNQLLVRN